MIKYTTAVISLAISGLAAAGTMGPVCAPGNVTVPCEAKGWDIGVQALYFKPAFGVAKTYRIAGVSSLQPVSFVGVRELQNDWDWGYKLEGSYHFNTGNDVTMSLLHYENDTNLNGLFNVPAFASGQTTSLNSATFASQNQFDQLNLILGQHVDVSLKSKLRFFGGLQYAHILNNSTFNYPFSSVALPIVTSLNQVDNNDFKGAGPEFGLDYSYSLTNSFSLTATGLGSLLYGQSRYNTGLYFLPLNVATTITTPLRSAKKRVISPSLEAKVGINYACTFAQGILNVNAGFQALNYFNSLQSFGANDLLVAVPPVSDSDFGLYGPYLGIKYLGNA